MKDEQLAARFLLSVMEWQRLMECALEHGAHAWGALVRDGQLPEGTTSDRWPPQVPEGGADMANVGHVPYHLAAMLGYISRAYNEIIAAIGEGE